MTRDQIDAAIAAQLAAHRVPELLASLADLEPGDPERDDVIATVLREIRYACRNLAMEVSCSSEE